MRSAGLADLLDDLHEGLQVDHTTEPASIKHLEGVTQRSELLEREKQPEQKHGLNMGKTTVLLIL